MFHYTYVLKSSDDSLYVGCTSNLERRLSEHRSGQVKYTKSRLPVELVYFEACLDLSKAKKREAYFKTGFGRKYLKTRIS